MGVSSASSYSITLWSKHWMATHSPSHQHKRCRSQLVFVFLNSDTCLIWSTHGRTHLLAAVLAPWPAQTFENVHCHLASILTGPGARPSSPPEPPSLSRPTGGQTAAGVDVKWLPRGNSAESAAGPAGRCHSTTNPPPPSADRPSLECYVTECYVTSSDRVLLWSAQLRNIISCCCCKFPHH